MVSCGQRGLCVRVRHVELSVSTIKSRIRKGFDRGAARAEPYLQLLLQQCTRLNSTRAHGTVSSALHVAMAAEQYTPQTRRGITDRLFFTADACMVLAGLGDGRRSGGGETGGGGEAGEASGA